MHLSVFDLGAGNLHSLAKALVAAGGDVAITADASALISAEAIVLPGVGAFGAAAQRLEPARATLLAAIARGTPVLGICLGLQLLFERSDEGVGEGLGVFAGAVTRLASPRVPHLGWNSLTDVREPLLEQAPLEAVYFAHSYACRAADLEIGRASCRERV